MAAITEGKSMKPWLALTSLWLLGLGCALSTQAATTKNYYAQHAIGWHWYDDPKLAAKADNKVTVNPILQMQALKQTVEWTLDKAILDPTVENVKAYIVLQNAISQRADQFSRVWQWALLQGPHLDFSLVHPTNQIGRAVYLDALTDQQDQAIKALAKQRGLFFFYHSQCPYCQRFAPIVKSFSERYGMPVVPITTDGIALPEFPNSRSDQGQAQKFQVRAQPALFTVDPYTHQAVPVAYGLISEQDLRQRILNIATYRAENKR
jgi:conjugal transfer pilus assembly protein TraF